MRYTLILLLFLISLWQSNKTVCAQFPQLYFETYTTADGLSSNNITCLYQDTEGFLWIGTDYGLNRFDGNIFTAFYADQHNTNSLSGNHITDIIQDGEGIFWIATLDGGFTRYDPKQTRDKQFMQFKHNPDDSNTLSSNRMTAIFDYDSNYLIVSAEGMSVGFFNKKTFELLHTSFAKYPEYGSLLFDFKTAGKIPAWTNWVHYISGNDSMLYVTFLAGGGVVNTYERSTLKNISGGIEAVASSSPHFEVDGNRIWLASWGHGFFMQSNDLENESPPKQKKLFDFADETTFVLSWDDEYLLVATRKSGLYLINKQNFDYKLLVHERADRNTLADNRIRYLLKDKQNILWIATGSGLSKYNPVQWQFSASEITKDYSKQISHYTIHQDKENVLRILTSNGMYKKIPNEEKFEHVQFHFEDFYLEPTQIVSLQDNTWFLNTENGTFIYEPETEAVKIYPITRYYSFLIDSIYILPPLRGFYQIRDMLTDTIDGDPVYVFSTLGWGMGVYNLNEDIFYDLFSIQTDSSIQNNMVRVLFRDRHKNYWVGTEDGLYKWKRSFPIRNVFESYRQSSSDANTISGNIISGMYEDKNGIFWITTNYGLNAFDGENFHVYTPAYTSSVNMYRIYADGAENLWIAVPDGFEVFNMRTKSFSHVEIIDKSWVLRFPAQILKMADGTWLYGAGNNLVSFRPEKYVFESEFPELFLTGFSVFDKEMLQTKSFDNLEFGYNDNFITISFSSLQLSQPSTVQYQYKLSGLNDDWISIGKESRLVFTSLSHGNYALLVRVTNPQGEWSDPKELVAFTIKAPFWQTWWFYIAVTFISLSSIYAIIKLREKQLYKLQAMRNKIANDLHDDVGSALSTISLYSEVAKMKSEKGNSELKVILDKISATSLEMQENMSDIVWSLQPRNDEFEHVMIKLKRFATEALSAKDILVDFKIDEALAELRISSANRKDLFLIYKEAINNIIKYAQCRKVEIEIKKNRNTFVMRIKDDGIGFKKGMQSSGNGLHSMLERTENLKGELKVISEPGNGTEVWLKFEI